MGHIFKHQPLILTLVNWKKWGPKIWRKFIKNVSNFKRIVTPYSQILTIFFGLEPKWNKLTFKQQGLGVNYMCSCFVSTEYNYMKKSCTKSSQKLLTLNLLILLLGWCYPTLWTFNQSITLESNLPTSNPPLWSYLGHFLIKMDVRNWGGYHSNLYCSMMLGYMNLC